MDGIKSAAELIKEIRAKKEKMQEDYADVINEVATLNGVDLGVGFEMLLAVCRGGDYTGDIEFDGDALRADYNELLELEHELGKALGA